MEILEKNLWSITLGVMMSLRLTLETCVITLVHLRTLGPVLAGPPKRGKYKVSVLVCSLMVELRRSRHCFLIETVLVGQNVCFY